MQCCKNKTKNYVQKKLFSICCNCKATSYISPGTYGNMDSEVFKGGIQNYSKEIMSRIIWIFLIFFSFKVQIFWEGHKNLAHLPLMIWCYKVMSKKRVEDGPNSCGLLRITELYWNYYSFEGYVYSWTSRSSGRQTERATCNYLKN